jgi:hypothetical protein
MICYECQTIIAFFDSQFLSTKVEVSNFKLKLLKIKKPGPEQNEFSSNVKHIKSSQIELFFLCLNINHA